MLSQVVDALSCPLCFAPLAERPGSLACVRGHSFDVARSGYVSLLAGDARLGSADTAEMVAARERFLAAGHFAGLADALADAVEGVPGAGDAGAALVDVGAGTGYYLDRVLARLPAARGIALDLSKHAARRAARVERVGAAVCDVWRGLPVRDGVATAVIDVFAPRNASEMARVLAPGGRLIVVTPAADHLRELVRPLGLLTVNAGKSDRVSAQFAPLFDRVAETTWHAAPALPAKDVVDVAAMGPSAHHLNMEQLRERARLLDEPVATTLSVLLSVYRRK